MIDIEKAKIDPASVFREPQNVFDDKTLTRAEKIDILQRWAYDEREMLVAEEENMRSNNNSRNRVFDEILKLLLQLGVDRDQERSPPTKQG